MKQSTAGRMMAVAMVATVGVALVSGAYERHIEPLIDGLMKHVGTYDHVGNLTRTGSETVTGARTQTGAVTQTGAYTHVGALTRTGSETVTGNRTQTGKSTLDGDTIHVMTNAAGGGGDWVEFAIAGVQNANGNWRMGIVTSNLAFQVCVDTNATWTNAVWDTNTYTFVRP